MEISLESELFPDEIVMTFQSIVLESEQSPAQLFCWNWVGFRFDFQGCFRGEFQLFSLNIIPFPGTILRRNSVGSP